MQWHRTFVDAFIEVLANRGARDGIWYDASLLSISLFNLTVEFIQSKRKFGVQKRVSVIAYTKLLRLSAVCATKRLVVGRYVWSDMSLNALYYRALVPSVTSTLSTRITTMRPKLAQRKFCTCCQIPHSCHSRYHSVWVFFCFLPHPNLYRLHVPFSVRDMTNFMFS